VFFDQRPGGALLILGVCMNDIEQMLESPTINLHAIPLADALEAIKNRNTKRRELKAAATPGYWASCIGSGANCCTAISADPLGNEPRRMGRFVCDLIPDYAVKDDDAWHYRVGNLDFIAHAKNDDVEIEIDFLVATVKRLQSELDTYQSAQAKEFEARRERTQNFIDELQRDIQGRRK
jgi:hypothetical protein